MEIMNNTKQAAANQFAFLNNLIEKKKEERMSNQSVIDEAAKKRAETLKNDTVFFTAISSRGYAGLMESALDGSITKEPFVRKGTDKDGNTFSAPTVTLMAVRKALLEAMKSTKSHVVIYMNEYEARRVSGMIRRIHANDDTALTEPELIFLENKRNVALASYGKMYLAQAKGLFDNLKTAIHAGKVIRVMGLGSISSWAIKNPRQLPTELAGKKAKFTNGFGVITNDGKAYRFSLASGFRLNGEHKLALVNGVMAVERPIKEGSEQELVNLMKTAVTQYIYAAYDMETAKAELETAPADEEEAYGGEEEIA